MLKNLNLLNTKLIEIKFEKINPNLLKDYLSLTNFKEITTFIEEKLSMETDPMRIEILNAKINLIISTVSSSTYYKKSIYRKITVYFYENRVDLYIKKEFTEDVFKLVLEEIPQADSFKIYIDNKETLHHLSLKYEDIHNFLENIKNKDEIKIKIITKITTLV